MDKQRFDTLAANGANMLLAAKVTGRLIAYEGKLNDHDVVILGARWPEDEAHGAGMSAKPLCVLIDQDVFDMLGIDGEKVWNVGDGE